VSDYGLDDRAIEVRSPTGADFLIAPASKPALGPSQPRIQWIPGALSPGVKRGRGVTLTTYPHLVPRLRMSRSYIPPFPQCASMECSGTVFLFCFVIIIIIIIIRVPTRQIREFSNFSVSSALRNSPSAGCVIAAN
jgi:hypothetical protein